MPPWKQIRSNQSVREGGNDPMQQALVEKEKRR
jgi:hypothetical protein